MFRKCLLLISIVMIYLTTSINIQAHHLSDHHIGHFRLPHDGVRTITNAAGEGLHINASSEAIDYAGTFSVYAPADGSILDVLEVDDFGWVVRIVHPDPLGTGNDVTSFFAHMLESSVNHWTNGDQVRQGDLIGTSSNSGDVTGAHLHFEARIGAVQGNVYSGTSVPITAIPGQWWHQWYSPSPNFQNDPDEYSGTSEYPPDWTYPSQIPSGAHPVRHLSNFESPSNIPAVSLEKLSDTSVILRNRSPPPPDLTGAIF